MAQKIVQALSYMGSDLHKHFNELIKEQGEAFLTELKSSEEGSMEYNDKPFGDPNCDYEEIPKEESSIKSVNDGPFKDFWQRLQKFVESTDTTIEKEERDMILFMCEYQIRKQAEKKENILLLDDIKININSQTASTPVYEGYWKQLDHSKKLPYVGFDPAKVLEIVRPAITPNQKPRKPFKVGDDVKPKLTTEDPFKF